MDCHGLHVWGPAERESNTKASHWESDENIRVICVCGPGQRKTCGGVNILIPLTEGWSPTGQVLWIAMVNNPFRIGRMGYSSLCVIWVDWSSSWTSGGELPFCSCVFADWVGICRGGGKTNTKCKSDNSHTSYRKKDREPKRSHLALLSLCL